MQDNNPILLSGGAKGADSLWGECATNTSHDVIHFTFERSNHAIPKGQEYVLSKSQLKYAEQFIIKANKSLHRKWPVSNPHVANLLLRNYYQIMDSESLYAISEFDNYGQVKGGTAWAVQMMIDQHPDCPTWVFDQKTSQWHVWKQRWMPINNPPRPSGIYTGIGSRVLLPSGERAIKALY